jgi:hypothetical protein
MHATTIEPAHGTAIKFWSAHSFDAQHLLLPDHHHDERNIPFTLFTVMLCATSLLPRSPP